mgnify:CR=1 FL=1
MKQIIFILLFISGGLTAQHRTIEDQDGERMSERTDMEGLKQGFFNYYNYSNEIIRKDFYINNLLKSRVVILGGNEIKDKDFKLIEIKLSDFKIESEFEHGEIYVLSNSEIKVNFYNSANNIAELEKAIIKNVTQTYKADFPLIITF